MAPRSSSAATTSGVQAFGVDGTRLWSLAAADTRVLTWLLAVHPDGSFDVGGGEVEVVPVCTGPAPCGATTVYSVRIDRFDADRSLRSSLRDLECEGTADHLAPSADGGLLSIIDCHDEVQEVFRLEP